MFVFLLSSISWMTGLFCSFELPGPIQAFVNNCFSYVFGVNTSEAEFAPHQYQSLDAFFTRRLQPGVRPIESELVSPADGTLVYAAKSLDGGMAVQVKSKLYSLNEVTSTTKDEFSPFWYACVYLSPKDYHRVHAPTSGRLTRILHRSGALWPVHSLAVKWVPQLFVQNERLIFEIKDHRSQSVYYVVMVGALNVGKMTTHFGMFQKNGEIELNQDINVGDELGIFHLGSTVVVVADEAFALAHPARSVSEAKDIRYGQSLLQ